jgi:nitrate reductase beta subunit
VGRIRYLGVMLYDADRIEQAASVEQEDQLYRSQMDIFLDPSDPEVIAQARRDGVPDLWLDAARRSPVYKMAVEWGVAFPLHPEYRTLPMVWYVPPLSPVQSAHEAGHIGWDENGLPDVSKMRIPVKYLANLLTAGAEAPVTLALQRMMAMRMHMRARTVDNRIDADVLRHVGLSVEQVEEMYKVMALADYEDRFVIPSTHREYAENTFDLKSSCGFSFGNGCSTTGSSSANLFSTKRTSAGHQAPRVEIRHVPAATAAAAPVIPPARPVAPSRAKEEA